MSIFNRDVKVVGEVDLFRTDLHRWLAPGLSMKKCDPITTFGKLLKSTGKVTGILTPVTIGGFTGSSATKEFGCNCFTADGKCLTFEFLFSNPKKCNQLAVIEGNVYTVYDFICVNTLKKSSETIKKDGIELTGEMNKCGYMRTVNIHGEYLVTVNMYEYSEKDKLTDARNEISPSCLKSKDSIDDYLLNLSFPCTAEDIYYRLQSDGFMLYKLEIKVQKVIADGSRNEIQILSARSTVNGKFSEYACTEGDETYGILNSGDWFYRMENEEKGIVKCEYSLKTGNITTTVIMSGCGSCDERMNGLIYKAKEKVDTIREKIEN